jgi:hypothetical protein
MTATNQQTQAYTRYSNSQTDGTKQVVSASVLERAFVEYVNAWAPRDPSAVTLPYDNMSFTQEQFFRTACSQSFHVYYSNTLTPPAQGAGNTLIVDLVQNSNNTFSVWYRGFTQTQQVQLNVALPKGVTSRNLELEDGVVGVTLKVLSQRTPNGTQVWNYQLAVNGLLRENYYLVPVRL